MKKILLSAFTVTVLLTACEKPKSFDWYKANIPEAKLKKSECEKDNNKSEECFDASRAVEWHRIHNAPSLWD